MANDDALRSALAELATSSNGRIKFRALTTQQLGEELGFRLTRSPNPVYDFEVEPQDALAFHSVAYTLTLDGTKRPATRAEALGRGLAAGGGRLFEWNPFLLIFDYVGIRFMAVSATKLFGAFAQAVGGHPIEASETATFSLTPGFQNRTVSMYATIRESDIWYSSLSELTVESLQAGLARMHNETVAQAAEIPAIVSAIVDRIRKIGARSGDAASSLSSAPVTRALTKISACSFVPKNFIHGPANH